MDERDDFTACAALVERGDPGRFRATMAAPLAARRVLFPLYAFNLEVARAPWVTQEPMIARMRLQWWRDALAEIEAGGFVRRHEVVTPLATVISDKDARQLDVLVEAREWDVEPSVFPDDSALWAYLDATAGGLIAVAARALGGGEALAERAGRALGLANWFQALPALEAAGRRPLSDTGDDAIRTLATHALDDLKSMRRDWSQVPKQARAAFYPMAGAGKVLRQAARDPQKVRDGALGGGELGSRLPLTLTAMTGRLW